MSKSEITELQRRGPVPVTDAAELDRLLTEAGAPADVIEAVARWDVGPAKVEAAWRQGVARAVAEIERGSGDHG
jgi:hypothetical protein